MKKLIDDYIDKFPPIVKKQLKQMRSLIKKNAPLATEEIKYRMPTFVLNGNLVHFAAFKNHIGFYPTPSAIKRFKKEITKYKSSKGAIQFPVEEKLPVKLIVKIVKYRVAENTARN
jgi:uncharacterized protein YdhG (YjbR/CyaY superfamily)